MVLVVLLFIIGPILWVTNCNNSIDSRCHFNRTTCELVNYDINTTLCTSTDGNISFECYQLILDCVYSNQQNMCMAPYKYFNSYQNALEYYDTNFYMDQNIDIYFDANGNCTYYGPNIQPYEQTVGIILVIIGSIVLIVLLCACTQQRKKIRHEYVHITPRLPKYIQDPPPYQTLNN